jgi:uncharacterized oxidoreductase
MSRTELRLDPDGTAEALTRIFAAAGGSAEEARRIAVNLVEANLAGHDSHGIVRTQRYCLWARQGNVRFGEDVETVIDGPSFALLDGRHGFGQTVGEQAVRIGIDRAREHGFAVIGLRRAGHLGRIGAWAEMACAQGLVSIHFVNVANSLLVAPFGGAERRMGTDPVAIGIPCPDHDGGGDFVLDFATSTVAEGKCLVAKRGGKPVPADALVGPDGRLTGNPDVLYGETPPGAVPDPRKGPGALTAMGAHKGSGLALACELLAGALTGSGTCGPGERVHNGMLSIYIDPGRLDDGHRWADSVRGYLDYVRACRPADPSAPVLTPGEPERQRRAERRSNGMPLAFAAWESILSTGEEYGLDRAELAALAER